MEATDVARWINDNLYWSHAGELELFEKEARSKDAWAGIEALGLKSDESFVSGLYIALFGRLPDAAGMKDLCHAMAAGKKRADVIRILALSEEARSRNLDVSWLAAPLSPAPGLRQAAVNSMQWVFWRLTKVRPRGAWSAVKRVLRRPAS